MITLVKPKPKDIKNMQELVAPEVASGVILPRSDDEISTNIRSYIIAKDDDKIVGFCALHIHAPDLAEIRSLIVDKNLRGGGIGSMMVNALLKEAKEYEISRVFTLTYQRRFFEKLGFKEIPKSELPAQKIWADCIKCKHFPVCDEIALIHNL
ncbi:N-acetyltransferase [Campylobacter sp. RM12920]|uniref:N-acetyltransferase n=1 Tax=Campylobacter californiensis TaxID=1032243 RepID=A0ABD4JKT0_9BACT|nr:N-acetyltransferase [Campylobacter sp. RM12919]MBE2987794.1 N-acetyltransferase [Campylobacter sp. RM12920]MBE3021508.1 N-acetyltransferase [Campylobacter sp. 7477a]